MIAEFGSGLSLAVLGLGRVGTTSAACLVAAGHRVHGVDVDLEKVAAFAAGRAPVVEPGVDELLRRGARAGLLQAGPTIEPVLDQLDMALVCVATPAGADGRLDPTALLDVLRQLGRGLRRRDRARPPLLVVVRSTLAPGTMDRLVLPTLAAEARAEPGESFEVAFNPEFLREGSALHDHRAPSRIVVGERLPGASRGLLGIYDGIDAPRFEVPFRLAESLKLLDNCFHALKVAFANEMGRLALAADVAPDLLADLFLADHKLNLSPAYLRPGGPYGGPCLPKDLQAALAFAEDAGLELPVLAAVRESNARHLDFLLGRIRAVASPPAPILLVGLSFKAGTDDLRNSPALAIAERLVQAGYELEVVDPDLDPERLVGVNFAIAAAHREILRRRLTGDLEGAVRRARLVILGKAVPGLTGRLPDGVPVVDIGRLRLP